MKVYAYDKCGTCRKAKKFLDDNGIAYRLIPIREQPPTKGELRSALSVAGNIRRLFNTSGGDYKSMQLKDKIGEMPPSEAIALLAANGNLVKRPFVVGKDFVLIGFDPKEWRDVLL